MRVRAALRKYVEALPWLFYKFRIIQKIFDSDNTFARLSDVAGDQGGVQSVTGDGVSGTPEDVVMTFPTAAEIGAIEDAPSDGKQYARKDANWDEVATGAPNLSDVLGEGNSANNMKITDLADGVDGGDAVNKSQLDALESPFEVVNVTQQGYSDIAIVVKDFDNIANGMTYQEGAIDFGVSRDGIHEMGLYSFRTGVGSVASGIQSFAVGGGVASGGQSFAVGGGVASGGRSFAVGGGVASGEGSFAMGVDSESAGEFSFAMGFRSYSDNNSFSIGNNSSTLGGGLVSIGESSKASGINSVSIGSNNIAKGFRSTAFGSYNISNEAYVTSIGTYTTGGAVESNWISGSPIFKVGNGTNNNNRKNAYTLYNDGRSEQEKDMEVTTIGKGFVLKSPDGTRWRITIEDDGSLITTELN